MTGAAFCFQLPGMEDASKVKKKFAERLKAARITAGWETAREFAKSIEIDENRYTSYEKGRTEPPLWVLARIRESLGKSLDHLVPSERRGEGQQTQTVEVSPVAARSSMAKKKRRRRSGTGKRASFQKTGTKD